jgi:hypothetical protein
MGQTTTSTVRNGIDGEQLLTAIDALGSDPQLGTFTFRR